MFIKLNNYSNKTEIRCSTLAFVFSLDKDKKNKVKFYPDNTIDGFQYNIN